MAAFWQSNKETLLPFPEDDESWSIIAQCNDAILVAFSA
jgi:hypothetical protein